jgi:AraC-like DNA-binding protein
MHKGLAAHYLENSHVGLSEIDYLLGHSEPNAFHRAFKRWFRTTATHFRKQIDRVNPQQQTLNSN